MTVTTDNRTLPKPGGDMQHDELKAIIEGVIFAATEPVSVGGLALLLGESGIEKAAVMQAIEAIAADYRDNPTRGLELVMVADGYQFRTKPDIAPWIAKLNLPKPVKLSQAAMETLAIVAYRQPLIRAEMEEIRGVDCGGVLKTLLDRNVIKIVGKRDEPGSPWLYGTTTEFLSLFNLGQLSDLPSLKDFHELNERGSSAVVVTDGIVDPAVAVPLTPIDPTAQVAMEQEDQTAIDELESQIRSLRNLEQHIFPEEKPEEAIDTALAALANRLEAADAESAERAAS